MNGHARFAGNPEEADRPARADSDIPVSPDKLGSPLIRVIPNFSAIGRQECFWRFPQRGKPNIAQLHPLVRGK
jgi:hypothetical protein